MKTPKFVAALALAASLTGAIGAATPASAQPKGGTTPKGCTVEIVDANGKTIGTKTVEPGTRIGLFVCGEDGEWHFGWYITGLVRQPAPKHPVADVTKAKVARASAS